MHICGNCFEVIRALPTYVASQRAWVETEPSYIICCDVPNPVEIERGELADYVEAYENFELDPEDLTDKEKVILKYLEKEGLIASTEILEDESAYAMVRDKQLELDIL